MSDEKMLDENLEKLLGGGSTDLPSREFCERLKGLTGERLELLAGRERNSGSAIGDRPRPTPLAVWMLNAPSRAAAVVAIGITIVVGWLLSEQGTEVLAQAAKELERASCIRFAGTGIAAGADGKSARQPLEFWVDKAGRARLEATLPNGGKLVVLSDGDELVTYSSSTKRARREQQPLSGATAELKELFAMMADPVKWIRQCRGNRDSSVQEERQTDDRGRPLHLYRIRGAKFGHAVVELSLDAATHRFIRSRTFRDGRTLLYDFKVQYLATMPSGIFELTLPEGVAVKDEPTKPIRQGPSAEDAELGRALIEGEPVVQAKGKSGTIRMWQLIAGPHGELMGLVDRPRTKRGQSFLSELIRSSQDPYYFANLGVASMGERRILAWRVWFPEKEDRRGPPEDATLELRESPTVLEAAPVRKLATIASAQEIDQAVWQYWALIRDLQPSLHRGPQTYNDLRLLVAWRRALYWNVRRSKESTVLTAPEYLDAYVALASELGAARREMLRLKREEESSTFSGTGSKRSLSEFKKRWYLCYRQALGRLGELTGERGSVSMDFHAASGEPKPGFAERKMEDSARVVHVSPTAELTGQDIRNVEVFRRGLRRFGLAVTLMPSGAARLAALTRVSKEQPLAVLVDGEVVAAPVVKADMEHATVFVPTELGWQQALSIAERVRTSSR